MDFNPGTSKRILLVYITKGTQYSLTNQKKVLVFLSIRSQTQHQSELVIQLFPRVPVTYFPALITGDIFHRTCTNYVISRAFLPACTSYVFPALSTVKIISRACHWSCTFFRVQISLSFCSHGDCLRAQLFLRGNNR